MNTVAIQQRGGGWVLYRGEERIGWWGDWNSLMDYAQKQGWTLREVPMLGISA